MLRFVKSLKIFSILILILVSISVKPAASDSLTLPYAISNSDLKAKLLDFVRENNNQRGAHQFYFLDSVILGQVQIFYREGFLLWFVDPLPKEDSDLDQYWNDIFITGISSRPLDLSRDVIESEDEIRGSTYLVELGQIAPVIYEVVLHGVLVTIIND